MGNSSKAEEQNPKKKKKKSDRSQFKKKNPLIPSVKPFYTFFQPSQAFSILVSDFFFFGWSFAFLLSLILALYMPFLDIPLIPLSAAIVLP